MTTQATERTQEQHKDHEGQQRRERAFKEEEARWQESGYPMIELPSAPPGTLDAQAAWQAYFDLVDQSTRTARRVTETLFIRTQMQQIVAEVRRQVLYDLQHLSGTF